MITEHLVFGPQAPGHGFLHWFLKHANVLVHSSLIVHSGLQFGGFPTIFSEHVQAGDSPTTLHCEFGPQGDGTHGFKFGNGSLGITEHLRNGSPVYPELQLQTGLWFMTLHCAFSPQLPGQGSTHFLFIHDFDKSHSELTIHSGRQPGGEPIIPCWHEQMATLLFSRQMLLGPHGEGLQGFSGCFGVSDILH